MNKISVEFVAFSPFCQVFAYKYYLISYKFCQIFNNSEAIFIEVKIPKEIRAHQETIFFGLSERQFICAVLAVGLAAGIYLGLGGIIGKEAASWLCLLVAAPVAIAGFFHYNGMTLEQFLWAFIKSEILCAGPRRFDSVNLHEEMFADIMEGTLE